MIVADNLNGASWQNDERNRVPLVRGTGLTLGREGGGGGGSDGPPRFFVNNLP